MEKVLVICGPTATGKTSLSVNLAKILNGEIINGDSTQVYKGVNILNAKVTEEEKEGVPHHLLDILEMNQTFSIADYQTLIRNKIKELASNHKLPIIVGGSGLYLKSALYDYEFSVKDDIKYSFDESLPSEELWDLLNKKDPDSATMIHPNNKKRIIRALQILDETGIGKAEIASKQEHKPLFDVLFLGLSMDRTVLYPLIDKRVDMMLEAGMLDEVKMIIDYQEASSTCMQMIGLKELVPYFEGKENLEDCVSKVKFATHQYAKRQFTWFNHQMDVKWVDVTNKTKAEVFEEALGLVNEWLGE